MKHILLNVIKILEDNLSSITAEFNPYILELQYGKRDESIMIMIFGERMMKKYMEIMNIIINMVKKHQHYKIMIKKFNVLYIKLPLALYKQWHVVIQLEHEQWHVVIQLEHGINIAGLSNDRKLPGIDGRSAIDKEAQIGTNVKIVGSAIMKSAKIGNGAQIFNFVICQRVIIGEKCHIDASIIGNDQSIPDGTRLTNFIK
uniref:Dynactin subunit 6 n=1 Tax=Panagrolaimus sp. PS1159 TaxID=55785 RepID=A0AC35FB13_9BILA